ncbi:MAG: 3-oxoacyl-[acyl-carrier-protein] synthase [Actinomycetota bacterium]|nr:3-oxoacyl-[acyl-carrier-protein] synthase [Actinomycetota bacterium]
MTAEPQNRRTCRVPARLSGIGHYFPGEPITNEYFEKLTHLGVDDAWIRRNTGVGSRHWPSDESERAVEMGAKAVEKALEDAGVGPLDIDLVIGTTATTRPRTNPSSATNRYMDISLPLQRQAGLRKAFCFDITAVACAGFLYGSLVAGSLMGSLGLRNALVVCAENPKPILNFDYRYSALFGAGSAAAVWSAGEAGTGLLDTVLHSDGNYFDVFDIDDDDTMMMKGRQVGELGPGMLASSSREVLDRNGLSIDDIDWFIPHQGNLNMVRQVVEDLKVPEEKVLINIDRRGNTSSVSIPSCLSENVADKRVRPGDLILACSIGRGFSWGASLFRYQ